MDALAAHLKQPHVARLVQAVPEMTEGDLEIAAHEVEKSGPLPLRSATTDLPKESRTWRTVGASSDWLGV